MTAEGSSEATAATTSPTTGEVELYEFVEARPGDYVQMDRAGFPFVNSAMNLLGDKDDYNSGSPQDDVALMFYLADLFESLETHHFGAPGMQVADNTGLDDDLLGLGLQPCVAPPMPMSNCIDQTIPFMIPDVVGIVTTNPSEWPNGRRLDEPVMDIILALILLDLGTHDITTFLDLDGDGTFGPSLNPLENDVDFRSDFPYLAPPH